MEPTYRFTYLVLILVLMVTGVTYIIKDTLGTVERVREKFRTDEEFRGIRFVCGLNVKKVFRCKKCIVVWDQRK